MLPYYEAAQSVFGLGPFAYDPKAWATDEQPVVDFPGGEIVSRMQQSAVHKRFGFFYRDDIANADNIDAYLFANAISVQTNDAANHVERVDCACLNGVRFAVHANVFVLALGGIENARLLLLSRDSQGMGLGNQHDLVGRYFSDHYYFSNLGLIVVTNPQANFRLYSTGKRRQGGEIKPHFALAPEVQRREKLLQARIHVADTDWITYSYDPDPDVADQLLNKVQALGRRLKILDASGSTAIDYGQPEGSLLLRFGAWSEVVPRHDSRVKLGVERDPFGLERVVVDWRIGNEEKDSLARSLRIFGEQIAHAGLGRARLDFDEEASWPWSGGGEPGLHHMGTTRMHDDPKRGVVDRNCRVHGVDNLFLAGSSVFPTYGVANPTLTIVALTLRLAEQIEGGQGT